MHLASQLCCTVMHSFMTHSLHYKCSIANVSRGLCILITNYFVLYWKIVAINVSNVWLHFYYPSGARHYNILIRLLLQTMLNTDILRNDPTIKTYFTVIIIVCGISLCQKINLYDTRKVHLPVKVNITQGSRWAIHSRLKYCWFLLIHTLFVLLYK